MSQHVSFPILSVKDLPAAVGFYGRLGFSQSSAYPTEGAPQFVTLERDGCSIGLDDRFSYWLYVDDVDGTFSAVTAAGAPTEAAPRSEPWGERVASVRDPDGNGVHLGAPSGPAVGGSRA